MKMHEVLGVNAASRQRGHSKPTLDHIRIHPAKNGGHIVEHHMEHTEVPYHEPEQHVFSEGEHEEMLAHIANALKLPEPKEEEREEEEEA